MPDISQEVIDDLEGRTYRYLQTTEEVDKIEFIAAGGSAAVFKCSAGGKDIAVKVYDPKFFNGDGGEAERRRLQIQRNLIGHDCSALVQTYSVEEFEETAFVRMEYLPWPQLSTRLQHIPDDCISRLISQLIEAVRFLESNEIVHRDIKPENIHITNDFQRLKLLDLGVARETEEEQENTEANTDHGQKRPFLATAQYSSPEYLFRLDEPSKRLWKGLNIYQVGAVLHDLIAKEPLFSHEMKLGNRWLVAKAVLTKTPTFHDENTNRLTELKALALRCLVKDLDTRLQLVDWGDFSSEGIANPLAQLRDRIEKGATSPGNHASTAHEASINFERERFIDLLAAKVRTELVPICGTKLPMRMNINSNEHHYFSLEFSVNTNARILSIISLQWKNDLYSKIADIYLNTVLLTKQELVESNSSGSLIYSASLDSGVQITATSICQSIATVVKNGLDVIDGCNDLSELHGQIL